MRTILVIDDDSNLRQTLKGLLEINGKYKVILADCGEGGLGIARAELPDLIILDIAMPAMDGFEVLKELKEKASTSTIPVIMLTAIKNTDAVKEAIFEYDAEFIVKPFEVDLLESTIARAIAKAEEE